MTLIAILCTRGLCFSQKIFFIPRKLSVLPKWYFCPKCKLVLHRHALLVYSAFTESRLWTFHQMHIYISCWKWSFCKIEIFHGRNVGFCWIFQFAWYKAENKIPFSVWQAQIGIFWLIELWKGSFYFGWILCMCTKAIAAPHRLCSLLGLFSHESLWAPFQ